MSENFKIALVIILGPLSLWLVIRTFIVSTDDLSDQLSVSTTSYMERKNVATTPSRGGNGTTYTVETQQSRLGSESGAVQQSQTPIRVSQTRRAQTPEEAQLAALEEQNQNLNTVVNGVPVLKPQTDLAVAPGDVLAPVRDDSDADMQAVDEVAADAEDQNTTKTIASNTISNNKASSTTSNRSRPTAPTKAKKIKPIRALDLAFVAPASTSCTASGDDPVQTGVLFRPKSAAIKGASLTNIDQLVRAYQRCGGGKLLIVGNTTIAESESGTLGQRRKDEVKYYLLQRRIPKTDILIPDNS